MSSARLTEVESKINEVRQRLANLSLSFHHDEEAGCPPAVCAINDAGRSAPPLVERDANTSVTVKSATPPPTGDMSRLVELAKREAAQRESCQDMPQRLGCHWSATASFLSREKMQVGPQGHTYYDPTPAAPPAEFRGSALVSAASYQQPSARPVRRAPASSSSSPQSALSCSGHCLTPRAAAAPASELTPERGGGFDPFQAVQARLREKLRRAGASRSPLSSTGSAARSPSPKLQEARQGGQATLLACAPDDAVKDAVLGAAQTELGGGEEGPQGGTERQTVEAATPNERAAADAICRVKQRLASPAPQGAAALAHASLNDKGHRQKRAARKPPTRDASARSSSLLLGEGTANRPSQRRSFQTPRRPNAVDSRRESPCRGAQPALPLKTVPQRTVLDVLTGAEVFALMRLRGIIVSRGETGECALPETRCHSVYLSPDEHKQLLDLRANLRRRSSPAVKPDEKSLSRAQRSASTRSSSRSLPARQSSPLWRAAPNW
ncbi:uncharacterized protein Tco025E_04246 [Trypanosoma conorhini]|uniref:Uncharacterized protein n=1 Tax=Trypanosoma conorhini TaxID=83891 RepID=A0A422PN08_9TRYP|nr:uncharacterized protein Tco025E_04246 [Trypanosoma conorhini]RNF19082.1 hypothetical protein Tco025E_04246 [Trypanosoma conorhini]